MSDSGLNLTARAVAMGAGLGVLLLAGATLGAHISFTLLGLDDGGLVGGTFQTTAGAAIGALGVVITFLFGKNGPPPNGATAA